jgi:hypothetical protein
VLAAWPAYQQSVEWARPTLFIADGVPSALAIRARPDLDLIARAPRFRVVGKAPGMLCDRYDVLEASQELFDLAVSPDNDRLLLALVADADAKTGKTRLLEEIAVQSVVEGFVPVIIRSIPGVDPPQTFLEFALTLSDAMRETREHFQLNLWQRTEARLLAMTLANVRPVPATDDEFRREVGRLRGKLRALAPTDGAVPPDQVRDAIRQDCAQLVDDVRQKAAGARRVLILIDELQRYSGAIGPILDNIWYGGLGTADVPIPVAISYVESTPEGNAIRDNLKHLALERRPVVKRFETDAEQQLVYRQLLLTAYNVAPNLKRDKQAAVDRLLTDLHRKTGGRAGEFMSLLVESFIDGVRFSDTLVDANYEDVLQNFGRT